KPLNNHSTVQTAVGPYCARPHPPSPSAPPSPSLPASPPSRPPPPRRPRPRRPRPPAPARPPAASAGPPPPPPRRRHRRRAARAAESLNMSRPAASKRLRALEDLIGVQLFERLPRGMRATWYGESLIRHARIALASLGEAGAEIEALRAGHAGNVSVGAIAGPAMTLLPPVLAALHREHPELRVSASLEGSDVLLEQLAQNRIDLMIGRLFPRHDKRNLHYEAISEEEVCAICRPGHPMLADGTPSLADLAALPWVLPPEGSVLRHRFELMFQNAGLEVPRRVIATAALVLVPRLLEDGDHLAVVPVDVARHYARHGAVRILPVDLSCGMDSFGFITR